VGIFIAITLDEGWACSAAAQVLVKHCPVEIFAWQAGRLVTQADQEDECTLCELCLELAPPGKLTIYKIYKDEYLVARGHGDAPTRSVTQDGAATKPQ